MAFIDARGLDGVETVESDLCVVGAGAAGLALAREFAGGRWRVALLESGGRRFSARTQALYRGETAGLPTYPLTQSRVRMFGGSTTRWTGQCRPLDPIDFEARDWIAHSGWPFGRAHLDPWYARAGVVCGLSPAAPGDVERPFALNTDELSRAQFRFGHPTDFGAVHGPALAAAQNIDIYLHANCVEIATDWATTRVEALRVRTMRGREFRMRARAVVLACGGIENARLLLASNRTAPAGLGNAHDLVGRFFMDHPYLTTGHFRPADPRLAEGAHVIRTFKRVGREQRDHVGFALSEQVQRAEGLNGCAGYFIRRLASETEAAYFSRGPRALARLREGLRYDALGGAPIGRTLRDMATGRRALARTLARRAREVVRPDRLLALRTVVETTPRSDSRITLLQKRDRLGMPQCSVDWRVNASDRDGLDRLRATMAQAIEAGGLGTLIDDPSVEATGWPPSLEGGRHHMGTTRMHADPRQGVVDADCRLHGTANLFIAGSSVFPTSGYANPTLTIVALALRLADHLKARMDDSP